jgi:hypothetical protein
MSRLVAAPRRNGFVILRTDSSLPVAPHPASRRMQLPSATESWHTPTRTSTVLVWRHCGRTHSRANGNPGFSKTPGSPPARGRHLIQTFPIVRQLPLELRLQIQPRTTLQHEGHEGKHGGTRRRSISGITKRELFFPSFESFVKTFVRLRVESVFH